MPSPPASDSGPPPPEALFRRLAVVLLTGVGLLLGLTITFQSGAFGVQRFSDGPAPVPTETAAPDRAPDAASMPAARPSHPSDVLSPYFDRRAPALSARHPSLVRQFHDLLDQYVLRQTRDDNFTIRVMDRRSNTLLERFELTGLRSKYAQGADLSWETVDRHRREEMERLVDTYEERGVPVDDITVRWGRTQQVAAAHERNRPYRAYERQLAEALGLSLLATEIGTVETFNRDDRVSAAGARSRYQMLPWILRTSGVHQYTLPTEGDAWIRVREERHPLLVLEPAFLLLRGYVNAVGHELPGLSAYHAGPGNIFNLYRAFYNHSGRLATTSTAADAYAWAVTEGFETVSDGSSFGGRSRGYVPALYGSLAARDSQAIEAPPELRAARLQVKPGAHLSLRSLLTALDTARTSLDWGPAAEGRTLYDRFRILNKHFDLPPASGSGIPAAGNVQLLSTVDGKAVRFFLPLNAPEVLRSTGITALDSAATFRFNASTYSSPDSSQVTRWDREYRALIDDIESFGFTRGNREQLLSLHERFEQLAEERPTRYRQRQLDIIRTHRRLWRSGVWEDLADATEVATGHARVRPLPALPPDTSIWIPEGLDLSGPIR